MRWRRWVVLVTLAGGCFHPTPWTPQNQRLIDEREGRVRGPAPVEPEDDRVAPYDHEQEREDAGSFDAGTYVASQ